MTLAYNTPFKLGQSEDSYVGAISIDGKDYAFNFSSVAPSVGIYKYTFDKWEYSKDGSSN